MKVVEVVFLPIDKALFSYLEEQHPVTSQMYPASSDVTYIRLSEPGSVFVSRHPGVVYIPSHAGASRLPLRLLKTIRRTNAEVIVIHSFIFPLQTWLLSRFYKGNAKLVVQHHAEQPYRHFLKSFFQSMAYRSCDAYLFAASGLAEAFAQKEVLSMDKVHEVMEGSSLFRLKDKSSCRARLQLAQGRVFLWVGRLNANKDPLLVLSALDAYFKQGGHGVLYMIYQTNEVLEEVKDYIETYGLRDHVVLVGKVAHEQLEDWYNAADYFVLGSHYEGSGYALCEAMACGCIPLVTQIPSFERMTGDGRVGKLFSPGNREALIACLKELDDHSIGEQRIKVRVLFDARLSYPAISEAIEKVFKSIT